MSRTRFAALLGALVFALPAAAEVKPHALFGDHMVLQRNAPLPKYAVPTPQAGFNPKPNNDKLAKWLPAAPENAGMFSAVAYYFARDLQKALNVPVGVIHTSWGGTPAQAWTGREVLEGDSTL